MPAISLAGVDSAGGGLIISSSGVQSTLDGAVIARQRRSSCTAWPAPA